MGRKRQVFIRVPGELVQEEELLLTLIGIRMTVVLLRHVSEESVALMAHA